MYVLKIATIIPKIPLLADNHLTRLHHTCLGFAVHVSVAPFTWSGHMFEAGSDFGQIGPAVSGGGFAPGCFGSAGFRPVSAWGVHILP